MHFGYHQLWSPMPIVTTTLFMGSLFYMYIVRLLCFSSPFYIIVFVNYEKLAFFMVLKHSHWVAIEWRKVVQYAWLHTLNCCLIFWNSLWICNLHTYISVENNIVSTKGKIKSMDDIITIVKSPCNRQESVFIWKATQARNYMNNLNLNPW
jgi:hypothetical protein